jgi:integrase
LIGGFAISGGVFVPSEGKRIAFGDFAISWLATWAIVKLKASAYREYESIVRLHLMPEFGQINLDEVTTYRIQVYVADKMAAGLAPRSIKNHVIVLKRVLGTAVDYGLLLENPVDRVALPRVERSEMRFLAPAQLRDLIEATSPSWRLLIALPALCGLRKGELLALTWDDIDTDAMALSISKSIRDGIISTPKTASSVSTVPLPQSLLPWIEQRRRQAGGHRLVFSKADGSPLSDATPNRVLARALVDAYLPSIRFHDLRHSWAVAHLRAGTDVKTLAQLGRWSSSTTLLETYAHVLPASGGDAVRRLDRLVNDPED